MPVESTIVEVRCPANIQTIAEIHRKLLQELKQNSVIELHIDNATDVDLTFVQLVEAARRHADSEGKTMVLSSPAEGSLHEVLQRGGFLATAASRNFWLHDAGDR